MLHKSNSFHYQQINTKESKTVSVTKESFAPRKEKGTTYTIIKTVKKTSVPKVENKGLDHKNISSNKYSENYSSYSKINKIQEGKSSRVNITEEKKSRRETSVKKCICGKDERNCTCGNKSHITIRGSSGVKNNLKSSYGNKSTFENLNCTCGIDHSKIKITETKTIIKSGNKKCVCGKKICTCGNEQKGNINKNTFVKKNENKTRVNSVENSSKKDEKKTTYKISQTRVKSEKRNYQSKIEKKRICDENMGCICGCTCDCTCVCTCRELQELEEERRRKQKLLEEQKLKRERERKRLEEERKKKMMEEIRIKREY